MTQEQLFRITIDEFNFSNRLYEYLTEKEIHTLGDLKDKTACGLGLSLKSPNIAAKEFVLPGQAGNSPQSGKESRNQY